MSSLFPSQGTALALFLGQGCLRCDYTMLELLASKNIYAQILASEILLQQHTSMLVDSRRYGYFKRQSSSHLRQ